MEKITFVSGSDARYFPMLLEWIASIRRFSESDGTDICILNTGMEPEQIKLLKPKVTKIVEPDWPCLIPARKIRGRQFLKSCVCRPFLKDFFHGYDIYFWMDADTWVQNWRGIDLFLEGAKRHKISLTGGVDRAYPKSMRVKFIGSTPYKARSFYYSNAKKAFGSKTAVELFPHHQLFAGAFCLHKDAPHWNKWQDLIKQALQSRFGRVFTAEQLTLGMMIHLHDDAYPAEILPAWTHWVCEYKPLWDAEYRVFREPYLPHEEISILHLSGYDDMRIDRSVTTKFKTMSGQDIDLSYRYPFFNGERNLLL